MLKFLTHKLRTHSLNEDNVTEKVEERDSGTESDDDRLEPGDICTDVIMKWNDVTDIGMTTGDTQAETSCVCTGSARHRQHPDPDHLYDQHSSEEELEVINGRIPASGAAASTEQRGAGADSGEGGEIVGCVSPPPTRPAKRKWPHALPDDEDDDKVETPVRFRTSPPLEALKPRRAGGSASSVGSSSTRRATGSAAAAAARRAARVRPALDFDKMQHHQLKLGGSGAGGAGTVWRAGGRGELSVYCW